VAFGFWVLANPKGSAKPFDAEILWWCLTWDLVFLTCRFRIFLEGVCCTYTWLLKTRVALPTMISVLGKSQQPEAVGSHEKQPHRQLPTSRCKSSSGAGQAPPATPSASAVKPNCKQEHTGVAAAKLRSSTSHCLANLEDWPHRPSFCARWELRRTEPRARVP
jgi:hypothetical protein